MDAFRLKDIIETNKKRIERLFEEIEDDSRIDEKIVLTNPHRNKPKLILTMPSKEAATALYDEITSALEQANTALIDAYTSQQKEPQPLRYKVSLVCADRVRLSVQPAYTVQSVKGSDVPELVNNIYKRERKEETENDIEECYERVRAAIKTGVITPENEYSLVVPTGNSYRITWFDSTANKTRQTAVGHVLIVYPDKSGTVTIDQDSANHRKTRADSGAGDICWFGIHNDYIIRHR